jgi:hypothetical protein
MRRWTVGHKRWTGGRVQLGRILRVFDSVAYDQPEYPDQPGTVLCCGLPVVMRGGSRVECGRCKRTVGRVADQWMVTEWGARGIKIHGW